MQGFLTIVLSSGEFGEFGSIRSVSAGFTRLSGFDAEDVAGRDLGFLFGAHTDPVELARLRAALADRTSIQTELTCYDNNGAAFAAELDLQIMAGDDAAVDAATLMVRRIAADISGSLHDAKTAADLSCTFQRSVLDLTSAGYWVLDGDGRTVDMNAALCRMLGRERDEILGRPPIDFVVPESRQAMQRQMERIPKQKHRSYEAVFATKSGTELFAHLDATTVFDDGGKRIGSFAMLIDLTDQRLAEGAWQRSELRFRNLAEGSLQGILVHRDGEPLFTNEAFASMHGYTVAEVMAMPSVGDLVFSEDLSGLQNFRRRQIRGQDLTDRLEHRAVRKDGSIIWAETCIHKVSWDGHDAIQITTYDITERKHAEQERQAILDTVRSVAEAEDFRGALKGALRALALNLQLPYAAIWLPNADGTALNLRAVWHNGSPGLQRFEEQSRCVDLQPGEGVAGAVWQSGAPFWVDSFGEMASATSPLSAAGAAAGIRFVIGAPVIQAGKVLAVITICGSHIEADGQTLIELSVSVAAQLGLAFERRQAQAAQQENEARFRLIATSSPVPMAILRIYDESIAFGNPACEQTLGIPVDHARSFGWKQFVCDESEFSAFRSVIGNDGAVDDFGLRLKTVAGEPIAALVTARWMTFEGESALFITFRDVTEMNRRAEEQRRLDAQLNQSRKMEALGTLAGGVAHDINNALVPILGLAAVTAMQLPEDSKGRDYLTRIAEAAERIRDLTQSILAFSRAENDSGGGKENIDLAAVVIDAAGFLRPTLPSSLVIQPEIDDATGCVRAGVTQVHQVIMNLLTNSAHAMDGRPGEVRIRLAPVTLDGQAAAQLTLPAGDYAHLQVADNGPGMPPEVMARIFDPFFTTKGVGEGTGLGLSVIHGIIVSLGGTIVVSSEAGNGARFDIFLPLVAADTKSSDPSHQADDGNDMMPAEAARQRA